MRHLLAIALVALSGAGASADDGFDYFLLSLSWSPNWCATTGDARDADQCDARHDHGWILHGLWPQYESGYPEYCRTAERAPDRRATAAMADVMGSSGLAWHQWKKHGSCSGLSAPNYYALSRKAYASVTRPAILRRLAQTVRIAPAVIEQTFLEANPQLRPEGVTVTCKADHIQEVRICLTRDLAPRPCGRDVARDCTAPSLFTPVR